ncbi:protein kinase domain-containing protein [Arthroderma uncinatum]|uniref:protein kinase domain-containing protein n=1 Tax=Arthroderma uncinatum TaxID=74035 RepID=UPI00144A6AB8|nr:protein kinase domain-containing protein [Arthroderma uncinatum]KAF3482568.1 protein kinase domain-containing protein [Arthroderma uncinatum]
MISAGLHLGNLALALPDRHEYSEAELLNFFSGMEATVLLALDPADQTDSLPSYVLLPIDLAELVLKEIRVSTSDELCVKITDFGNAFRQGDLGGHLVDGLHGLYGANHLHIISNMSQLQTYDMIWGEAFFTI